MLKKGLDILVSIFKIISPVIYAVLALFVLFVVLCVVWFLILRNGPCL